MEEHTPSTRYSCCSPFSSSPLHAVRSGAAFDTIFGYDSGLLKSNHMTLDVYWDQQVSKTSSLKRSLVDETGSDDGSEQCWDCKTNLPICTFHGIFCNPLLTSRLALMGLLGILVILMTVLMWVFTSANVQYSVTFVAAQFRHELLLEMKMAVGALLQSQSASAMSLATYLSLIGSRNVSSLHELQAQVRPVLFLAFSFLSKNNHISFFTNSGLFLSYGFDRAGAYLLYASDSYLHPTPVAGNFSGEKEAPWNPDENLTSSRPWYHWYYERVNITTGLPDAEANSVTPVAYWDQEPVKSALHGQEGSAHWGFSNIEPFGPTFSFVSSVHLSTLASVSAISVGAPLAAIQQLLEGLDFRGGVAFIITADGRLVAQTGISFFGDNGSQTLPFATESSNLVVAGAAKMLMPHLTSLIAKPFISMDMQDEGKHFTIDSMLLQVNGVALVCVLVLPHKSIWGVTEKRNHTTLMVLVTLATCMGLVGCFFVFVLTKGVSNEMRLRAALIQQLEETKRAEAKSSHKSLVFANMSHDLRTPLAAILGLIDLCFPDAPEQSELESNLLQMKSCASNLLGILNTILDMSKIESGKLLLQESSFNLVNALEEVVDTFCVMGVKKGVEVALDLSDGSLENTGWVIGDVGRVKQIMANLLSNGVKFTSEGHVVLRAWVKPLCAYSPFPQGNQKWRLFAWPFGLLLGSSLREKKLCTVVEGLTKQDDENYMQVEFEVDDTGRGIPKERWRSVFENFVQVESSGPRSYDGTGLGLGIVRSLVRLMGGDIVIIDKDEPGESGTRFHFNLIFKRCCKYEEKDGAKMGNMQLKEPASLHAPFRVNSVLTPHGWHLGNMHVADSPPICEGVHVLLAMQGQAGKRIVKRWMERRGLQVWMINDWDEFLPAVQIIKQEVFSESVQMSERFDLIPLENHYLSETWIDEWAVKALPKSRSITGSSMGMPLPSEDELTAQFLQTQGMHMLRAQVHLLLVVDVAMVTTTLDSICSSLEDILLERADQQVSFKVIWLVNATTPSNDIQYLRRRTCVCHLVLHNPLYASRLQHVWCLLQQLVGDGGRESHDAEAPDEVDMDVANSLYTSLSCMNAFNEQSNLESMADLGMKTQSMSLAQADGAGVSFRSISQHQTDRQGCQCMADASMHVQFTSRGGQDDTNISVRHQFPLASPAKKNMKEMPNEHQNALCAMHVLVAEDNPILQKLAKAQLTRLGATVECVDNGAEAARLVLENLYKSKFPSPVRDGRVLEDSQHGLLEINKNRPFDLVLMDCEMPILNGYEATRRIRSEERRYSVHTPVIALTAHAMLQDERKCIEAGMDFYLTKPLAVQALLDAVTKITAMQNDESR